MTIYPDNPLKFDFIVDMGNEPLNDDAFEKEAMKLIRYFMVSLTMPEKDMWVNLSPYEENRIIEPKFAMTEMGQTLLEQDYILKQLTSSLLNPENKLGEVFWKEVYDQIQEKYGTQDIPLTVSSKIWIIPDKADIYVDDINVYVFNTRLKVLMEEEYLSLECNLNRTDHGLGDIDQEEFRHINESTTKMMKDLLLPAIEKEVNEGKAFANLRQIYNSLIMAAWYKKNLRESLLGKNYIDRQIINGVNTEDHGTARKIYNQYMDALKQGTFSFIREEYDPLTEKVIPRKYFSGGIDNENVQEILNESNIDFDELTKMAKPTKSRTVTVQIHPASLHIKEPVDHA